MINPRLVKDVSPIKKSLIKEKIRRKKKLCSHRRTARRASAQPEGDKSLRVA